jgi:hypothetical protein
MRQLLERLAAAWLRRRIRRFESWMQHPDGVQQQVFRFLIDQGRHTVYGYKHRFGEIATPAQFREQVPIRTYEQLYPWIERSLNGEADVLWPGRVSWFAKSSGTTNDRSKFIPITKTNLNDCHFAAGRDVLGWYFHNTPDSRLLAGRTLSIGGSHQVSAQGPHARCGDLSAVILANLPRIFRILQTPPNEIALIADYELKLERMLQYLPRVSVTAVAGVPTWTLILFERILRQQQQTHLRAIWPLFEVYFHGGVSFVPYRELFRSMCPEMRFMEVYNASEGFLALQNDLSDGSLLLMLDHGIYFEFVPLGELEREQPHAVGIESLQRGEVYAPVLSTSSGLWRYLIGDTVRIESLQPLKIRIVGRTQHFINVFGEELMIDNVEQALSKAMERTGARVSEYLGAPIFLERERAGGHEWVIEFSRLPESLSTFVEVFDRTLQQVNTDYEAKRSGDLALRRPRLHVVPEGTFYSWMKERGKLGGQNKVPRLSNDRRHLEQILSMVRPLETI